MIAKPTALNHIVFDELELSYSRDCSTLGRNVPSLIYDEPSVPDVDAIAQVDYGANIVGWFIAILSLCLLIFYICEC